MPQSRHLDPPRYVGGLLLWQGAAWLVVAGIGPGLWIATLAGALTVAGSGAGALWRAGELLAIAVGAGLGATEVKWPADCGAVRGCCWRESWQVRALQRPPGWSFSRSRSSSRAARLCWWPEQLIRTQACQAGHWF